MAKERKYTLVHSYNMYDTAPDYTMYSTHPANSKKWCAQVKDVQRITGVTYNYYESSRGGRLHRGVISNYRYNFDD